MAVKKGSIYREWFLKKIANSKLIILYYRSLDVKFAEEHQKLEVASTYS